MLSHARWKDNAPRETGMDKERWSHEGMVQIGTPAWGNTEDMEAKEQLSAQENVSLICRGLANRILQANIVPAQEASVTAHNLRFVRRVAQTSGAGEGASKLQPLSCDTSEKLKDGRGRH
jgi:hypothetical protein